MIANSRCIAGNLSEKRRKNSENIQVKKRKRNLFRKLQGFYINMGI